MLKLPYAPRACVHPSRLSKGALVTFLLLLAGLQTMLILASGLPTLRQDWWFPHSSAGMASVVHWYADGWSPYGFGSVQPYPTFYPLSWLWWLAGARPSPLLGVAVCIFITLLCAGWAAVSLAPRKPWFVCFALASFAMANPWVYQEYLVGHLYMVAAYALLLALVVEIARPSPRPWVLALLVAGSMIQLEFAVLVCLPLSAWCIKTKRFRACVLLWIFASPLILGIAASYGVIHATPYGLDWQFAQSVHINEAFLLRGYPFHENTAPYWALAASLSFAITAGFGAICCARGWYERGLMLAGILLTIYASGLDSFWGFSYQWLVLHIKETGLFRELYDLLACLAIAMVPALAAAYRSSKWLAWLGAVAGSLFVLNWIAQPIGAYALAAQSLPHITPPPQPQYRVALLPAFQPLSYRGLGAGADPDAFIEPGRATPLNEWFPSFPTDAALAYAEAGRYDWVQALGAEAVIRRPYFAQTQNTYRLAPTQLPTALSGRVTTRILQHPINLFSLTTLPLQTVSVGDRPDEHAVFFGDLSPERITTLVPSMLTHDPRLDWVDARVEIPKHPQEASALGGVVTTSTLAFRLPLPARSSILARAEGVLCDEQHRVIISKPAPLRWYPLPVHAHALICRGRCMIALSGDPPAGLPEHALLPVGALRPLDFHQFTPWLSVVQIPAQSAASVLRYNTRYDRYWFAFTEHGALKHWRLDTAMNAWTLTPSEEGKRVIVVQLIALLQALTEWVALLSLLGVLWWEWRISKLR